MVGDKDIDISYLKQTLELARTRRGFCAPNPPVGALIVRDGQVIATGYHFGAGFPHAEVEALKKVDNKAPEATIYVSLEPCCHWGRTPPCTDALIKANVKRVIYGYRDPNPIVSGKGEAALIAAGIACEYIAVPEIDAFYQSYQHWHRTKTPFITAKIAVSLDGKIAGKQGEPIQITGQALKEFTHQQRKDSDAILTTAKTIILDNPQMNVRLQSETIAKPIYILDSELNLPLDAKLFETAKSITVFHAKRAANERQQALTELGVRCISVEENEGLNLNQVIEFIGKDGIHDLWVEAGGKCFAAFVNQKLVQRAFIYIAPWVMGEGMPAFTETLDLRNYPIQSKQYGKDVLCEIHW